ncbi:sigma-54-dependent transcriptional regulator [Candidatus Poribacteria bacterium]
MSERKSGRVLIVDDEPMIRDFLYDALSLKGYTVMSASSGQEALDILRRNAVAAVITDVRMPRMSGTALLKKIKEVAPSTPVVVITAYGTVSGAVEIMKQGANDYLPKPFSATKLHEVIEDVIHDSRGTEARSGEIITVDPQMLRILETVDKVANSKASVFIQGESGTGKELIARAIHERGNRSGNLFVAVNCAALPETLLESELFGHEQGAFTGAISRQIGKFELAHRGTLLLDEIAEMTTALQAKLLRCLQEDEIDRIGCNMPIKVDVRIIATTNKEIKEEVRKQRFRDDLFYRLRVVQIVVPPLRDRRGDIPLLTNHFLDEFSHQAGKPSLSISEQAMEALKSYNWPGNVRELENMVAGAVILCRNDVLSVDDLFSDGLANGFSQPSLETVGNTLEDVERHLITSTLEEVKGNKARAAEILGVTPRTIRNKLRKYTAEKIQSE